MFVVHDTLPNQRKNNNNTMPTHKIFKKKRKGNGFFSKKKVYYAFIAQEVKKKQHIFLINFQSNIVNFSMVLNLVDVHQYQSSPKNHYKTPPITLILKYVFNFSYYVMCILSTKIYLHMFKFVNDCWSLFKTKLVEV
jgi:hypothetical protein